MALTLPCAVALMVIPVPLISILFERGAFTATDSAATGLALAIYGLGLPAFVLQKIFQPLYFAREDTRRPFYFALVSMLVNVVVAVGLWSTLDYLSAALATSLASWSMVALLWFFARGYGQAAQFDTRVKQRLPRILAACLLMGVVLYGLAYVMAPALQLAGWRYLALAVLLTLGALSYARAFGAFVPAELRASLKRKR